MIRKNAVADPGAQREGAKPEERADHAHHQEQRQVVPPALHLSEIVLLGVAAVLLTGCAAQQLFSVCQVVSDTAYVCTHHYEPLKPAAARKGL